MHIRSQFYISHCILKSLNITLFQFMYCTRGDGEEENDINHMGFCVVKLNLASVSW